MIQDSARKRLGPVVKRHLILRPHRILYKARASLQQATPPGRPVFIIGCPRSGTSVLFTMLARHPMLASLQGEGHILWSTYQHPSLKGWTSDRAAGDDIRNFEPRYIYAVISHLAGSRRFLDKTPRNILKLPYLSALFPDAVFILIKRDGRATVSSIIEGWTVRHGIAYRLPVPLNLEEYKGRMWSYLLPEGWRALVGTTIATVAATQYASAYNTALADLERLGARHQIVEVAYEDLVAESPTVANRLLHQLDLPDSDDVMKVASDLGAYPVVANTPPRPDKWRSRSDQLRPVVPIFADTMRRLGYEDFDV